MKNKIKAKLEVFNEKLQKLKKTRKANASNFFTGRPYGAYFQNNIISINRSILRISPFVMRSRQGRSVCKKLLYPISVKPHGGDLNQ